MEKKKKSDLLVLDQMAAENKDVRCTQTLVSARKVIGGGHITFGVDDKTFNDISMDMALGTNNYYCILYVINKKQFDSIKNTD